jgi:hypothetical protein
MMMLVLDFVFVWFSRTAFAAIVKRVEETGDPCGIEFMKGFGISDFLSNAKARVRFDVKACVHCTRYVGVCRCYMIWTKIC